MSDEKNKNDSKRTQIVDISKFTSSKNPLDASNVYIIETKHSPEGGEEAGTRRIALSQKIDEYIFKLGYSSVHVMGILMQLLIDGKIRVDFRHYNERLELTDKNYIMSRADALVLLEKHINSKGEDVDSQAITTQKVIVQLPNHLRKPTDEGGGFF